MATAGKHSWSISVYQGCGERWHDVTAQLNSFMCTFFPPLIRVFSFYVKSQMINNNVWMHLLEKAFETCEMFWCFSSKGKRHVKTKILPWQNKTHISVCFGLCLHVVSLLIILFDYNQPCFWSECWKKKIVLFCPGWPDPETPPSAGLSLWVFTKCGRQPPYCFLCLFSPAETSVLMHQDMQLCSLLLRAHGCAETPQRHSYTHSELGSRFGGWYYIL